MIKHEIADFVIDRIRAESSSDADAKKALAEYALTEFDIKLKRSLTFPNMLKTLKTEVKKLNKGGVKKQKVDYSSDEIGTGSLIKELLSDDINGGDNEAATEEKDEPIDLNTLPGVDVTTLVDSDIYKTSEEYHQEDQTIHHQETIQEVKPFKLDPSFTPRFSLLGAKPGYYTIQPEIAEWIESNQDWQNRPDDIGLKHANTLKTYIYYINKDGRIILQDARNQKFIVLN